LQPSQEEIEGLKVPFEAQYYEPQGNDLKMGEGKKGSRKVFGGSIQFDDFEDDKIRQFNEYAAEKNLKFISEYNRKDDLRFIQGVGFDIKKAAVAIQSHMKWRRDTLPIQETPEIAAVVRDGIMYVHGRDHRFRPVMYVNAKKLDLKKHTIDNLISGIVYILEFVKATMFLDGKVENWIIVINFEGLSLTSVPYRALKKVMGVLQDNYRGRLGVMFMINVPSIFYTTWTFAKRWLDSHTVLKIKILKGSYEEHIQAVVHRNQLEAKYGGNQPNLSSFWPPSVPSNTFCLEGNDPGESMIKPWTEIVRLKTLSENKLSVNILTSNQYDDDSEEARRKANLEKLDRNFERLMQSNDNGVGIGERQYSASSFGDGNFNDDMDEYGKPTFRGTQDFSVNTTAPRNHFLVPRSILEGGVSAQVSRSNSVCYKLSTTAFDYRKTPHKGDVCNDSDLDSPDTIRDDSTLIKLEEKEHLETDKHHFTEPRNDDKTGGSSHLETPRKEDARKEDAGKDSTSANNTRPFNSKEKSGRTDSGETHGSSTVNGVSPVQNPPKNRSRSKKGCCATCTTF